MSPIHLAHSALADEGKNFVGAEPVAFRERHVGGLGKSIPSRSG